MRTISDILALDRDSRVGEEKTVTSLPSHSVPGSGGVSRGVLVGLSNRKLVPANAFFFDDERKSKKRKDLKKSKKKKQKKRR